MFVSEDGYVNGSIDNSKLDEVEAKSPEAKARLEQLKAERDAANAGADADAERLAKLHEAQSIQGQVRETVTTQARSVEATPEGAKLTDQKAADQSERASARRSSSDKG
jgi:multidrug resistance efflux pump